MSISLQVHLGERDSTYRAEGMQHTLPVGSATLAALLTTDPPAPEDLTNAIGLLADHLEDVVREVPAAGLADEVVVCGPGVATLAAVEVGAAAALPFALGRAAAEEVFRTLATESAADRRHNPGLPVDEVESVLGVCCAVVALLRRLDRQHVTLAHEQVGG
jgi:exopolyphosphatase/guanosine-5'-triphosphate,3'-diphosphate pyrophosphatase